MTDPTLDVLDAGQLLQFGIADLMRYHGPLAPGGVALGFVAMRRALPLLDPAGPPERREIHLETAFPGPGARDAVELVTRAVTGDRYVVDPALNRTDRGPTLEWFVFRFGYRGRSVTLIIREGLVTDEFIALARGQDLTATQECRLTVLKQELSDRLLAVPADEVFDVGVTSADHGQKVAGKDQQATFCP